MGSLLCATCKREREEVPNRRLAADHEVGGRVVCDDCRTVAVIKLDAAQVVARVEEISAQRERGCRCALRVDIEQLTADVAPFAVSKHEPTCALARGCSS